jgi:hypothetical protein
MKLCFFTSINNAYFGKAKLLARSVKTFYPDSTFVLALLDDLLPGETEIEPSFDEYLFAGEIYDGDFDKWIFNHTVVEACTAQKGLVIDYLLRTNQYDAVIYLDPDIKVYAPLDELIDLISTKPVVVTPHLAQPAKEDSHIRDNEFSTLIHGVFNLGFLAIRNCAEGLEFSQWWKDRLLKYCFDEKSLGLFTDQKWVDLAPAYFDFLGVLRHPGYNIATWNLENRRFTKNDADEILVNEQKIRFIHFSGFDSGAHKAAIDKYASDQPLFGELSKAYTAELLALAEPAIESAAWKYSTNSSGQKILPSWRRRYRDDRAMRAQFPDPYLITGAVFERSAEIDPLTTFVLEKRPSLADCEGLLRSLRRSVAKDLVPKPAIDNVLLLMQGSEKKVCFITHGLGGGTDLHTTELARFYGAEVQVAVISAVRIDEHSVRLVVKVLSPYGVETISESFEFSENDAMDFIEKIKFDHYHVHHVMGAESLWYEFFVERKHDYALTVHDYFLLTENWSMISPSGEILEILAQSSELGRDLSERPGRRKRATEFVESATQVIFPSNDVYQRFSQQIPIEQAVIAPHPERPRPELIDVVPTSTVGDLVKIAVIGDFGPHKGSLQIIKLAKYLVTNKIRMEVHHFGPSCHAMRPFVVEHGTFQREKIGYALRSEEIDLVWIPSQVHETYSYVLSDVMVAKLPVLVAEVGALPERILGRTMSRSIKSDSNPQDVVKSILAILGESPINDHDGISELFRSNDFYTSYLQVILAGKQ